EDGLTIVLVTHDPTVAAHADRIIRIRDGIIEDEGGEAVPLAQAEPVEPARAAAPAGPGAVRAFAGTTSTALRSLRRNALRPALTTLGIIIGVASLIAIAEIGKGSWTAIRGMLAKTGVDDILIQAGAASRNGVSLGSGSIKTLTPEDGEAILRECSAVD